MTSVTTPDSTGPAQRCPFCSFVLAGQDRPLLAADEHVVAFEDAYPSTPGHTLIIPRRHVARIRDLTSDEYMALWSMALTQLRRIGQDANPDGFTVGVNDGPAAGQTVNHVHLHVIPRNTGDTPDARGGVRWAVPETADYWSGER